MFEPSELGCLRLPDKGWARPHLVLPSHGPKVFVTASQQDVRPGLTETKVKWLITIPHHQSPTLDRVICTF